MDPRYPSKFEATQRCDAGVAAGAIVDMAATPAKVRAAGCRDLATRNLILLIAKAADVRQVVHHIADSHMERLRAMPPGAHGDPADHEALRTRSMGPILRMRGALQWKFP